MNDPLAPWEPTAADPFDLAKAGHLLRRAGFGGSLPQRRRLQALGVAAAVDDVAGPSAAVATAPDGAADELLQTTIAFGEIARVRAFRVWLALRAEHPLAQRTSCFWQGHFATSDQKLRDPRAMALQQATFDRCGLGTFDALVAAMCRDPALLRWLDNDVNTKQRPNENFARELFELFTLGRGHYTEADVREAARCFTGWHVRDGVFWFHARLHDDGEKQLFGRLGPLDGDDVIAATVARRESAEFLADRWLRFFVHPEPERAEVDALANVYVAAGRDVRTTLVALLRSRLFFSARAYRAKVKSPADFTLGLVRALGARAAPTALAHAMASLGETWLEPPSVEGWHGERAWLSPAAWLLRSNFAADLLAGRTGKLAPRPAALFAHALTPADVARIAGLVLLDGDVRAADVRALADVAAAHGADTDAAAVAVLHAATCLPDTTCREDRMTLDRRSFLQLAAAVPVWWSARGAGAVVPRGDDRTLLVLELVGGNDGLNTVIPHENARYAALRPKLSAVRAGAHALADGTALHPALRELHRLVGEGRATIVHGVGHAAPDRSHFRSREIWHVGDPAHVRVHAATTGWLGRAADVLAAASDAAAAGVPAAALGSLEVPLLLKAHRASVPSLRRIEDFQWLSPTRREPIAAESPTRSLVANARAAADDLRSFVAATATRAVGLADELARSLASYRAKADYPDSQLARDLQLAAQLVVAGFGTRLLHVGCSGFDTHARQLPAHAGLLAQLDAALAAFTADLAAHGAADRVVVLVHSEFGRRAAENASQGTDHGAAGPVFVLHGAGTGAGAGPTRGGVLGPVPDLDRLDDGDPIATTDFRSVYRDLLDWLRIGARAVLGGEHAPAGLWAAAAR